jgi:Zn-dependent peptidase ImmA (M78 family)
MSWVYAGRNIFAAELLMPEPAVTATWERDPSGAGAVELFAVSAEAMHWRLFNLGLVENQPARS